MSTVATEPPEGFLAAQRLAIETAEAACAAATPGVTERELAEWAEGYARRAGATGFWGPTLVGFGVGTLRCCPTELPEDRPLRSIDLGHIDILPTTADGWWGDCARSLIRGDNPRQAEVMSQVQTIHERLLAKAEPGMRAKALYAIYADLCAEAGLMPLDRLINVGHSIGEATSYGENTMASYAGGYIDPWNETEMWGAWAIEPYVGDHLYAIKVEDVVWFGPDGCIVMR